MAKKITFIFFLLIGIFSSSFTQKVDYKAIFLDESQSDTTRIKAAQILFAHFQGEGIDSLLWQIDILKKIAEKNNSPEWSALRYQIAGGYYLNLGKPDSALIMSEKGILFAEKSSNPVYLSRLLALNGLSKVYTEDLDGAKKSFNRAYSILDKNVHFRDAATALHYEGVLESNRDNYLQALGLLQESIRMSEKAHIPALKALALIDIAGIFQKLDITEEATATYQAAAALFEAQGDTYSLASSQKSLLSLDNNEQDARAHFSKGIRIAQERGYTDIYQNLHFGLGDYYQKRLQLDSAYAYFTKAAALAKNMNDEGGYLQSITKASDIAIKTGKEQEGIRQLEAVLPKLKQLEDGTSLVTAYSALSTGYKQQGQVQRAFFYLEKYVILKDSLYNKDLTQKITRQYLNDLHEKEKEQINAQNAMVQLKADNKLQQQRALTAGLGVIMLLLGGLIFVFVKNLKERKTANERLERLNQQLQNERESLAKSNQMLHGFALSVSHDILNNIDFILSTGNILVGTERNSKALGLYFDQTQRIGQQLKEYCVGLLQSTLNYHQERAAQTLKDPNPIVQQILERFAPLLEAKNFTVERVALPATQIPLAVVSQVFQNLVSNAIRYASEQKEPLIYIGTQQNAQGGHDWVIEDNGPGIPAQKMDAVFNDILQSEKGYGVGLVQVKAILSKYNAQITVEKSSLGGARFIITTTDN